MWQWSRGRGTTTTRPFAAVVGLGPLERGEVEASESFLDSFLVKLHLWIRFDLVLDWPSLLVYLGYRAAL